MFIIATYDVKFKTNQEKIENIFLHYGMRKIQKNTFIANNVEIIDLKKDINEFIRENDSVLLISICKSCYNKKEVLGRELKFKEDLYRIF